MFNLIQFNRTDRNGYKPTSNSKPKIQEPISTPKIDVKKFEPTHENTDLDFGETGSGDDGTDDEDTGDDGDGDEDEDLDVGVSHKNHNVDESTKRIVDEDEDGLGGGRDLIPTKPEIDEDNEDGEEDDEDLKTEVQITDDNSSNIHLSNTHSHASYSFCRGTDKQKTNETRWAVCASYAHAQNKCHPTGPIISR